MGLKEKAIKYAIKNAPQIIKYVAIAGGCVFGLLFMGLGAGGNDSENSGGFINAGGEDILFDFIASYENGAMLDYIKGISDNYKNPYVRLYITKDKLQYLCGEDYGLKNNTRNFGFGVAHRIDGSKNHVEGYAKYDVNIAEELYDHIDGEVVFDYANTESNPRSDRLVRLKVDIVDSVKKDLIDETYADIEKEAANANVTLSENQKHAYISLKYQQGPGCMLDLNNPKKEWMWSGCVNYTADEIKNMTKQERAKMLEKDYAGDGDIDGKDKRRQAEWLLWSTGLYITMSGDLLNPDDYKKNESAIKKSDSFENFLFIGDSLTVGLAGSYGNLTANDEIGVRSIAKVENEFKNAHFYAKSSMAATYWNENINVLPTDNIKTICVLLGVNDITNFNKMEVFIKNLAKKYPNTPIYIQKVFPVSNKYTYINYIDFNEDIRTYNTEINQKILDNNWPNVKFIDTSQGLIDSSGLLDNKVTGDGLHLNSAGQKQWVSNLKQYFLK